MPLSFEMPPHLASSPKAVSIQQVVHPIFLNENSNLYPDKSPKPYMEMLANGYTSSGYQLQPKLDPQPFLNTQSYWQKKLVELNDVFQIAGEVQQFETKDRLILRNERYNLHVYKASNSFVYFDRQLVSPTDPVFAEKLISETSARKKSEDQLAALNVLDKHLSPGGIGYTGVAVDNSPEDGGPLSEEYRTEIKVHYGFKINGLPVFGPGAKVIASYAGTELSQLIYFWRNPRLVDDGHFASSKVAHDRPLISQDEALHYFAHDNRFAKFKKGHAKVRFHDLQIGYYSKSPQDVQRFLYPVYRVKGTLESWKPYENGYGVIKEQLNGDVFRYNFTLHMLAVSDPNLDEKRMFGTRGKTATIF